MKKEIPCSIVQDILPNYIENLTSNETNQAIEHHMATCEECKKAYEQMNLDLVSSTMKAPVIEMKFFKKIKITKILAAVITVILTLNFSYMLYATEYKFANDKNILSAGITEFLSKSSVNAYVVETKEVDGKLIATFKDSIRTSVNGAAIFTKGFNQKYRIISAEVTEIYRNREGTDNSISTSTVKEDLWMIYISMCAVMELGVILMAFFLIDIVKEKIWISIYVIMELGILLIAIFLIK